MINKNLFSDLFLESHKPLAIKSLQILNNFENMVIIRDNYDMEISIIEIKSISEASKIAEHSFLQNLLFRTTFEFTLEYNYLSDNENILNDDLMYSHFMIINDNFYSFRAVEYKVINAYLVIKASLFK